MFVVKTGSNVQRQIWRIVLGMILAFYLFSFSAHAQQSSKNNAISRSYTYSVETVPGNVVSLSDDGHAAGLAHVSNEVQFIGIVVDSGSAILDLVSEEGEEEPTIQVATSGTVEILVSDLDGNINGGDVVALSRITGAGGVYVGQDYTLGTAKLGLDEVETTARIVTIDGEEREVNFGRIPVGLQIGAGQKVVAEQVGAIGSLRTFVGQDVPTSRLYISAAILMTALCGTAFLLYGSVRSAITAIGRNPLSKSTVYVGLAQTMAVVIVVNIILITVIWYLLRGGQ